jgi:aminoglycoside phosphotransferase (APT) family kinase protein
MENRTRAWVETVLGDGARVVGVERLRGGWTSEMRELRVTGAGEVVLRSFVKPFFVRHAAGLLTREAATLRLLAETEVPAPVLLGVDAGAELCAHPSLLMSRLPGRVRVEQEGHEARIPLLARQLVRIHEVRVPAAERPRAYQAWTAPERVRVPDTDRPGLWERAVAAIRRESPAYEGCFLHRDFHPGNVLIAHAAVSGVVDWVETSWGPADLDVAHCSTALALLHGVPAGLRFADEYAAAGGRALAADPGARRYWRLLDALAFAPDAEKVGVSWRALGRTDLTPGVLARRLEAYVAALMM